MSKTDKDRPYWVRANDDLDPDRIPYHTCGREHKYRWTPQRDTIECDIDEPRTGNRDWSKNCYWDFSYSMRYGTNNVPKWFVDHTWNNVERTRERTKLGEIRKDFNANFGYADTDFPNFQHRHRSRWYWD